MYAVVFALLIVIFYVYAYRERYEGEIVDEGWNAGGRDVLNGEPQMDDPVMYYTGTHGPILKGEGVTPKACYDWAKRHGLNHWGWRKNDKSCFFYADPSILTIMRYADDITNRDNVKIGCTEPGMYVINGCMDWTKGDMAWGKLEDATIKKIKTNYGSVGANHRTSTFDECRRFAADQEYDAFVYATNRHSDLNEDKPASCYGVYKSSVDLYDFLGSKAGADKVDDYRYISACVDSTKKVHKGCK